MSGRPNRLAQWAHLLRSDAQHVLQMEYTRFRAGDRVVLESTTSPFTGERVPAGTFGTVEFLLISRQVCVRWDNGVTCTVAPGQGDVLRIAVGGDDQ